MRAMVRGAHFLAVAAMSAAIKSESGVARASELLESAAAEFAYPWEVGSRWP